jgi:hypothetical protein
MERLIVLRDQLVKMIPVAGRRKKRKGQGVHHSHLIMHLVRIVKI